MFEKVHTLTVFLKTSSQSIKQMVLLSVIVKLTIQKAVCFQCQFPPIMAHNAFNVRLIIPVIFLILDNYGVDNG